MANNTVLVVDDAATVRLYHGSILRQAGYGVQEAVNGYEGLEAALADRFALLVVDVNMPVLDGYSLVEAVRRQGPNQDTPIMMVSTESSSSDAARGYAVGANLYLTKPVAAQQLALMASMLVGSVQVQA